MYSNRYYKNSKKYNMQSRNYGGYNNMQICFMNDLSDNEDSDYLSDTIQAKDSIESDTNTNLSCQETVQSVDENDLNDVHLVRYMRLQTEAKMALIQAKEMARMQIKLEQQKKKTNSIPEMVRNSFEKVGIPFPERSERLSGTILTEMNVAQLQVIVNDLHTQIEKLNEDLVKYLMDRDELYMEQDSMLVDIEDLAKYLEVKEESLKQNINSLQNNNDYDTITPSTSSTSIYKSVKPHIHRIASIIKKY